MSKNDDRDSVGSHCSSSVGGVGYHQEMWVVPKDVIYNSIGAIQLALGYMPQVKTDVPQWQVVVDRDVERMRCALDELKKLVPNVSR